MKKIITPGLTIMVLLVPLLFTACKKTDPSISEPPLNTTPIVNTAPKVDGGADIKMTLPNNSTKLSCSGYDAEGNIENYSFIKISGPESYGFSWPANSLPEIFSLEDGEYEIEFTAKDTEGLFDKDTVKITVSTNFRKYILNDLQPDPTGKTVAQIPEDVKNNTKWVFVKSAGYCQLADAGPQLGIDYEWGGNYYEFLPENRISVYGGYTGYNVDILIYYL